MNERFVVDAGKYEDGGEENCKFSDEFHTLHEAMAAMEKVKPYPWSRIVHFGPGATIGYVVELTPLYKREGGVFNRI